jgi:hypothetical protein
MPMRQSYNLSSAHKWDHLRLTDQRRTDFFGLPEQHDRSGTALPSTTARYIYQKKFSITPICWFYIPLALSLLKKVPAISSISIPLAQSITTHIAGNLWEPLEGDKYVSILKDRETHKCCWNYRISLHTFC